MLNFGPAGINGLNLLSNFAILSGALICLLGYDALRRA